ncbi:MAG: glycosyltransferase family 39 protein [Candidatus Daviesbacteria bacterium]|nr:glycosyltransferase family 39 protein [Candidatus Daviesbacteria bacterium]
MKKATLILLVILLISIFFRTYQIIERFGYNHDSELFSWITKDIIVNQHPRLLGQLTSAPGIFIGPFFYYMLVPFFMLFQMDPIGALIPITIIGVLTTLSFYLVFSRLFNQTAGLIAAFLQAILFSWVTFDRQIVPSTPSNLWTIWYFYTVIQIARGKFSVLPLLGVLIGLIWHIHIALLPTLFALPFAFLISKKLPRKKEIVFFLIALFITNLPLLFFEARHNFSQTQSLIENFTSDHGGGAGFAKFTYIIEMLGRNIHNLFISPYSLPEPTKKLFMLGILSLSLILIKKKLLTAREVIPLSAMLAGVIVFFSLSSSFISEYYLYSIEIIFVSLVVLAFSLLMKYRLGKYFVILILGALFLKNSTEMINGYIYKKGYLERKGVVEFITADAKAKGFPCIGISYITSPGENTGFRYFLYLKKQHLVHPSFDVPVYNIVIPDELSLGEVKRKFGHIGVIPPQQIPPRETIQKTCQTPNTNLSDSLFGYVE